MVAVGLLLGNIHRRDHDRAQADANAAQVRGVAEEQIVHLDENGRLNYISNLACADARLRSEYDAVLPMHAKTIVVTVRDFDFSQIMTLIAKRLTAKDGTMPMIEFVKPPILDNDFGPANTVVFDIDFEISGIDIMTSIDTAPLFRWLSRMDSTTKEGPKVVISYRLCEFITDSDLYDPVFKQRRRFCARNAWREVLSDYMSNAGDGRAKQHAGRIRVLLLSTPLENKEISSGFGWLNDPNSI